MKMKCLKEKKKYGVETLNQSVYYEFNNNKNKKNLYYINKKSTHPKLILIRMMRSNLR